LREFEVPMAGGFYLTQDCGELRDLFDVDREVARWDRVPDLIEKIRWYLDHPAERAAIAAAGHARCMAQHTWGHRFASLLAELGIRADA
jgi:spore maturation protein CgeB